ncbi:pentatricopeptide repeat-containing protein At1g34160 [Apium graveolens]|uniref:pentatricopeptide repeat-containing protein At1g34160 n=1 Tax=Apium graveolens TaxID=4045 RepID=UPI003D7B1422
MSHIYSLLKNCTTLSRIKLLQSNLIITGSFTYFSRSKLLDFCATSPAGDLSYAVYIFQQIRFPATNDWNAIIRGLAITPQPTNAVTWFVSMSRASCKPDALTCSFVLKACARALAVFEAREVQAQVLRYGFVFDVLLQTTLLDVYAKSGDLDSARNVFDEMSVRDVACWNVLIYGLAQGSRASDALMMYKEMEVMGLRPDEVTVLGALSACSQLGAIREGERVVDFIRVEGMDCNVQVCNAVIDMYAKCGLVDKAFWVFSSMKCRKCIVTWNTMIMALAMQGDGVKAIELFDRMGEEGMVADSVSYLGVLCACNHAGMVEDGVRLFESMGKSGVSRNVKHYGSVVDLLGRAGRLQEAYDIVNELPMVPDLVLWQTLLGASKTYGNVEMAEKASRKLEEMGSSSCGDFVLLSNVYAAQERWKDVGRVREAMKSRDVRKIPGFSYIEAGGVMHKFVNGDRNHLFQDQIYRKLDEISFRIKEHGYMAETSYVLHDIGEGEKENALWHHSEKLAVAYGLIATDEKSAIQVNKNIRICGDCHVVFKFISKVYEREIIVRDRTRFHRFKEGCCSCRDYW